VNAFQVMNSNKTPNFQVLYKQPSKRHYQISPSALHSLSSSRKHHKPLQHYISSIPKHHHHGRPCPSEDRSFHRRILVQDEQLLQEDDAIYLSKSKGAPRECHSGLPALLSRDCPYARDEIDCAYTEGELDSTDTKGEPFQERGTLYSVVLVGLELHCKIGGWRKCVHWALYCGAFVFCASTIDFHAQLERY
jgi:hypothetical protein